MTADDLDHLFATPQIHTDDAGVHRDAAGREYVAVEVEGETRFDLAPDGDVRGALTDLRAKVWDLQVGAAHRAATHCLAKDWNQSAGESDRSEAFSDVVRLIDEEMRKL